MKIKLFLLIVVVSFSSCYGLKFNGKKGAKNFYQVFYIDQGVLQYFVKPLEFKGDDELFLVDFTFRDTVVSHSLVTINYSIYTPEAVKQVDSAFFIINNDKIKLQNCERFFIEFKKKTYQIRNSCTITYEQLIDVTSNDLEVWAYYEGEKHVFVSTKRTLKVLEIVKEQIIDIIELNRD